MDRTTSLIGSLDFAELRVRVPRGQIFLCGGILGEHAPAPPSVREALLRHLPARGSIGAATIILAERAIEALPDSSFHNLLDLEEYLAGIVDAVVLIVESPGSICELGAFAKTPEIREKLVTLISNAHFNRPSFITLGALKYLKSTYPKRRINPFDWQRQSTSVAVPLYALNGMVEEINDTLSRAEKSPKFNPSLTGHKIYLTLAFCHILRGAKLHEIKTCFAATPIDDVSELHIKKYLDILRICGLVERVSNGSKRMHFISLVNQLPIRAAFRPGLSDPDRDILRWIQSIAYAVAEEDPIRVAIFQEHNHAT